MKFQRARGLRVTGKLDQATASALGLQAMADSRPGAAGQRRPASRPARQRTVLVRRHVAGARAAAEESTWVSTSAPRRERRCRRWPPGASSQIYRDRPGSLSGNGLKIATADGTYFFYAHLADIAPGIDVGVPVSAGQTIGTIGSTGNAAITHLPLRGASSWWCGSQSVPLRAGGRRLLRCGSIVRRRRTRRESWSPQGEQRRRSNHPGISQAKGPTGEATLESSLEHVSRLAEGERPVRRLKLSGADDSGGATRPPRHPESSR